MVISPETLAYVRTQQQAGFSAEAIRYALSRAGWDAPTIEEIFRVASQPVERVEQPAQPHRSAAARILGIVVLLVVVCGGVGYYLLILQQPTPDRILTNALTASLSPHTFSFMATSTGTFAGSRSSSPDLTVVASGWVDARVFANPAFSGALAAHMQTHSATSTTSFTAQAGMVYAQHQVYGNLTNFTLTDTSAPSVSAQRALFVSVANQLAASVKNTWVLFDISAPAPASAPSAAPTMAPLQQYLLAKSYITNIQLVGSETLDNQPVYHLLVSVHGSPDVVAALRAAFPTSPLFVPPPTDPFNTRVADVSSLLTQPMRIELWIGKNDSLVYKLSVAALSVVDRQTGFAATVGIDALFRAYGTEKTVVPPAGATPFSRLWQGAD